MGRVWSLKYLKTFGLRFAIIHLNTLDPQEPGIEDIKKKSRRFSWFKKYLLFQTPSRMRKIKF